MIFDSKYKLPKPNGAGDWADSSHLAGFLAVIDHPQQVNCLNYVIEHFNKDHFELRYKYVRHPDEKRFDFSRDQAIMLMCGLIVQGHPSLASLDYIDGKDLLPPSVRGIERIARYRKPTLLQSLWFKAEILWHAYVQPLDEPCQIIAMCRVYGREYLRLWTKHNKLWRWSIRRYWSQLDGAWRGEHDLAEYAIRYVESEISK